MSKELPIPAELWDQVPPAAQEALLLLFRHAEQRIAQLEQQVADLSQRLNQNSSNSSKPPSSDGPAVKRSPPRPSLGRKQGGQPGHAFASRPLLPPDRTHTLKPHACRRCGHALHGTDPQPLRHQVLELPVLKPDVTEYQLHRLRCPGCGTSTCAPLPDDVPSGQAGPRLQATLALLAGAYRLSKDQIESLCADVFGIPLCAGTVCALERKTAAALDPVVAEIRDHVQSQSVHIDETSWRQRRQRGWLWVVVTNYLSLFQIVASRGAKVAKDLIGEVGQRIVTSDRYSAYSYLPVQRRQVCWAHLKRDFQAMVDRQDAGSEIGEELLCFAQDVFTWWYRVRDGTGRWRMSRSTLQRYVAELRPHFRATLEAGAACGCAKTAGVCAEILKVEPALWTFVREEGIEPTNNAAERALRHAVVWRKTSYGTESEAGSRFVGNILTVVASCRQQGKNVLEFLTRCCAAACRGEAAPSLLPQTNN